MKYCVRCGLALYPDMVHWLDVEVASDFFERSIGPLCSICWRKLICCTVDQCRVADRAELPVHLL